MYICIFIVSEYFHALYILQSALLKKQSFPSYIVYILISMSTEFTPFVFDIIFLINILMPGQIDHPFDDNYWRILLNRNYVILNQFALKCIAKDIIGTKSPMVWGDGLVPSRRQTIDATDGKQCLWRCIPYGLTLIPARINKHMPNKVWYEITYPSLTFNGCPVEVLE